jgi:hypothetical protein
MKLDDYSRGNELTGARWNMFPFFPGRINEERQEGFTCCLFLPKNYVHFFVSWFPPLAVVLICIPRPFLNFGELGISMVKSLLTHPTAFNSFLPIQDQVQLQQ